ncbi:MAG: hypothetical protein JWQ82_1454, partial [Tardiphaga sp.]|nr:hypothetical protein [Tardiphaga sp.]
RLFAPLGMTKLVVRPATVGFGKAYPEVWLNLRGAMPPVPPSGGVHLCLRAKSTDEVDAFHEAAVEGGGVSESAPSLRPHDRVRYYAAFIADPDGNRIEAVTFLQGSSRQPDELARPAWDDSALMRRGDGTR